MSYQIAVFLHLLAAFTWIGGTLFLIMVLVPLTRQGDGPPGATAQLLEQAARKFRPVAWSAILVLVVSGLFIATDHFDTSVKEFFEADTRFVKVLQMKVGMVIIVVALSAVHDFVLGPRLSRKMEALRETGGPPAPASDRDRKALVVLARVNLLLILVIVGMAVTLTRGSPV